MSKENAAEPAPASIVIVATDLSTGGGVNRVVRDLAQLFAERLGLIVTVASARSARRPSYAFPPSVTVRLDGRPGLLTYFIYLWRLRGTRPEFVMGLWAQDNILIVLAFLFSRSNVVLVEHAPWHFQRPGVRALRRLLYPLAWRVIVLNPTDLSYYQAWLRSVRLIANPVPGKGLETAVQREKLIVGVGHLTLIKNFADAIRAMWQSGLEADGWSLAIIGEGPERDRLLQLIVELGLTRTAIHPPTSEPASWYRRASLALITSQLEVFSLVLAEAMLAGVVPIAYRADGPSFILEDFPKHLVAVGDVDRLAARLQHIAQAPDLEPIRKQLAGSISTRFSPDTIAAKWQELLSDPSD